MGNTGHSRGLCDLCDIHGNEFPINYPILAAGFSFYQCYKHFAIQIMDTRARISSLRVQILAWLSPTIILAQRDSQFASILIKSMGGKDRWGYCQSIYLSTHN